MAPPSLPSRRRGDIRAIFVHAGAGFHSIGNERLHLKACEDACKAAMAILKAGGTAVDAVEMAVRVLEDREITNAGYGSNLAVDGTVECDAIVVDHCGRSGAVGAVAQIKNPISLARLILDRSTRPLLLRRVPPNLLCGEGATRWAYEQGMDILSHDGLVSPAARDRWKKWVEDLDVAEKKRRKRHGSPVSRLALPDLERARAVHKQKMLSSTGTKQSGSPAAAGGFSSEASTTSSPSNISTSSRTTPDVFKSPLRDDRSAPRVYPYPVDQASRNALINSTQKVPTLYDVADIHATSDTLINLTDMLNEHEVEMADIDDHLPEEWTRDPPRSHNWHDGSSDDSEDASSPSTLQLPSLTPSPPGHTTSKTSASVTQSSSERPLDGLMETHSLDARGQSSQNHEQASSLPPGPTTISSNVKPSIDQKPPSWPGSESGDNVTDTVGAIAIDIYGNIAAGASSGGIGMKHQGRIGPAALVGVGASVISVQENDPEHECIATVTSGTGEHMATTMAAQTCSERMYHGVKKGSKMVYPPVNAQEGGVSLTHDTSKDLNTADHDDDVVRSFVENDFTSKSTKSASA